MTDESVGRYEFTLKAYTDYSFAELGDTISEKAPIRECTVLWYDGDKYCCIKIGDLVETYVKVCYVYAMHGRRGRVPSIVRVHSWAETLNKLKENHDKWWKEQCA